MSSNDPTPTDTPAEQTHWQGVLTHTFEELTVPGLADMLWQAANGRFFALFESLTEAQRQALRSVTEQAEQYHITEESYRRNLRRRVDGTPIAPVPANQNEYVPVELPRAQSSLADHVAVKERIRLEEESQRQHRLSLSEWRRFSGSWSKRFPLMNGKRVEFADVPGPCIVVGHGSHESTVLDKLVATHILDSYTVEWTGKEIARDIWQNFYDGHRQTIEGVRFSVHRPKHNGDYSVLIEGGAEYPYHLLVDLGGTSKKEEADSAGHFGEGAKIIALLLLRDFNAGKVVFRSVNWSLEFSLQPLRGRSERMLCYTLRQEPFLPGNSLEIALPSADMVHILSIGANCFKHPHNKRFHNPTYQNRIGGFKYIPGELGLIYIGGQVRALAGLKSDLFEAYYPEFSAWLDERPADFAADRDRSAIQPRDISRRILAPIVSAMSDSDLAAMLLKVRPLWPVFSVQDEEEQDAERMPRVIFGDSLNSAMTLPEHMLKEAVHRKLRIDFPPDCVAMCTETYEGVSRQERDFLRRQGFHLYNSSFAQIGMQRYDDQFLRKHIGTIVEPDGSERQRIGILRETLKILVEAWQSDSKASVSASYGFAPLSKMDIHRPIYLFESPKNSFFANREHVFIDQAIFWNRGNFSRLTFEEAVESFVKLQMLTFGSEKSELASYALTNFIAYALSATTSPTARRRINLCKRLWT